MSASIGPTAPASVMAARPAPPPPPREGTISLKGVAGGLASGGTKWLVGQPFDLIKVRMQCSPYGTFRGPLDCLLRVLRNEGLFGLYKGAALPLLSWSASDALLMGSLHQYRIALSRATETGEGTGKRLPTWGHALAGLGAGSTNSIITAPVELIKAKLQMQQASRVSLLGSSSSDKSATVEFSGPRDCARQIVAKDGVRALWRVLPATLLFRANFAVMFSSYDALQSYFASLRGTSWELSSGAATFLSGGLAAEAFWLTAFPFDVVKNRMMADSLHSPKYPTMKSAFLSVWDHHGKDASLARRIRTYYTGFTPCLLRAFPTNALALLAFEATMKLMGAEKTTTQ